MGKRKTWDEIRKQYPDQWVSLGDVEFEENGEVKTGMVIAADANLKRVTEKSKGKKYASHKFKFTGEIKNFLGFAKWDVGNAQID